MGAAAVLGAGAGAGAADQLHVEMLERLAQSLGVAVPGQHDIHGDVRHPDQRQQHELAVPHADDAGVVALMILERLRHLARLPGGARDEADVARQQRAGRHVIEFGLVMDVRHPAAPRSRRTPNLARSLRSSTSTALMASIRSRSHVLADQLGASSTTQGDSGVTTPAHRHR